MTYILGTKDADKFERDAKEYTIKATLSKEKAQQTLISLGIYTKDGKLSKDYDNEINISSE